MPTQENKALVRRIEAAMNARDVEALAQMIAPDATNHGRPVGRAGFRRTFVDIFATFPDWHTTIEELVAEGETVVTRNLTTATHLGTPATIPIHNMQGIAPTGRPVVLRSIHIWHIRDGLAISHMAVRDDLETMKQIGLWPPTAVPTGAT